MKQEKGHEGLQRQKQVCQSHTVAVVNDVVVDLAPDVGDLLSSWKVAFDAHFESENARTSCNALLRVSTVLQLTGLNQNLKPKFGLKLAENTGSIRVRRLKKFQGGSFAKDEKPAQFGLEKELELIQGSKNKACFYQMKALEGKCIKTERALLVSV